MSRSATYSVKELFYTLQGEGAMSGRAAVFLRFSGCNLWTGRESDRAAAICQFCDTDFVGTDGEGGGKYKRGALVDAVRACWEAHAGDAAGRFVVCTGGEPALQLDQGLVDALHDAGFEIAIETNGTLPLPSGIDWVCVSPKASAPIAIQAGDELKLVYPQSEAPPSRFETLNFRHFFLQPKDDPQQQENTRRAVAYCQQHPQWRLSLQTHKIIGIP